MAFYNKIKNGKLSLADIKRFAEDSGLEAPEEPANAESVTPPPAPPKPKKSKSEKLLSNIGGAESIGQKDIEEAFVDQGPKYAVKKDEPILKYVNEENKQIIQQLKSEYLSLHSGIAKNSEEFIDNIIKNAITDKSFIESAVNFAGYLFGISMDSTMLGSIKNSEMDNHSEYTKAFNKKYLSKIIKKHKEIRSFVSSSAFIIKSIDGNSSKILKSKNKNDEKIVLDEEISQTAKKVQDKSFGKDIKNEIDNFKPHIDKLLAEFKENENYEGTKSAPIDRVRNYHSKLLESGSYVENCISKIKDKSASLSRNFSFNDLLNVAIIEQYLHKFINGFAELSRPLFSSSIPEEISLKEKEELNIIIRSISLPRSKNLIKVDGRTNKIAFDKDNIDNASYSVRINLELEEEYVNSLPTDPDTFSDAIISDLLNAGILKYVFKRLDISELLFIFECKKIDNSGNIELSIPQSKMPQNLKDKVKTGSGNEAIFSLKEQGGMRSLKLRDGTLADVQANKKNNIEKKSSSAQTSPLYSFKDEHGETVKFTITDLVTNKGKVKNSKGKYVTPKLKKSKPSSLSSMVNNWKPKGK